MKTSMRAVVATAAVGLMLVLTAGAAQAHEFRTVGKYGFLVGFATEPPYAGAPNGVSLNVTDGSGKGVADIGNDFTVEVQFGDQSMQLEMEPKFEVGEFGTVGEYGADFVPTRPGKYTFHFTGSIKGQDIDESFTSSPDGFSEVLDTVEAEFPVKDPTTGQLAERLDHELPRVSADAADASDSADGAKTLTYVAIGLAGLALVLGLIALARGGKRA